MSLATLRKGQRVIISGAAGTVEGLVIAVAGAEDLVPIPEAPDVALVAACMTDLGIAQVAYITHLHAGRLVTFAALGDGRGRWRDLHRQELTITAVGDN